MSPYSSDRAVRLDLQFLGEGGHDAVEHLCGKLFRSLVVPRETLREVRLNTDDAY